MFNFFHTSTNNIELAHQLFLTLCVGSEPDKKYQKEIKKIQDKCTDFNISPYPDRQLILLKVIALTGSPETPLQRYLLAIAYAYSRATYRKKAIYYLNLYLDNELCYKILIQHSTTQNYDEARKKHLINMYNYLFKAYIGEHLFNEALEVSEKMISIYPQNPIGYFDKVEALTKTNNLSECKKWLKQVKESEYYQVYAYKDVLGREFKDDWFYTSINQMVKETNEKIKKGYIYKPRKQI